MSRRLILVLLAGTARAQPVDKPDEKSPEIPDQGLGAEIGIAGGGRVTPGGLRLSGHYFYQLSSQDWFDGTASFTFGSSDAACFRDRMDYVVCDHGFLDGRAFEGIAQVRRYFTEQGKGKFVPFVRLGVGVAVVRFGGDDVTGLAIPLHAGGGVRAAVSDGVAVAAQADLTAGIGRFGRGMGNEPQFGIAVTAGAEFKLP